MTLEKGARIELSLLPDPSSDSGGVRYRLEVASGEQGWHGQVLIEAEKGVVRIEGAELPPWIEKQVSAQLRAAWRAGMVGVPWPGRIRCWRAEPGCVS